MRGPYEKTQAAGQTAGIGETYPLSLFSKQTESGYRYGGLFTLPDRLYRDHATLDELLRSNLTFHATFRLFGAGVAPVKMSGYLTLAKISRNLLGEYVLTFAGVLFECDTLLEDLERIGDIEIGARTKEPRF